MHSKALSVLFLCWLALPSWSQQPSEVRITIQENAITVGALLDEISRQSGADFAYNSEVVDESAVVTFYAEEESLIGTLDLLVEQLGIRYMLIEGQVVLNFAPPEQPEDYILSGYLTDETTGENLIGATVAVVGTSRGTVSNEFGYYALELPEGTHAISYSYLGYESRVVDVDLQQDQRQSVALLPNTVELPEVIVELPRLQPRIHHDLGRMVIPPEELNDLPEFAGESGLVKGMQGFPGVQAHGDGSAFFYVRGGERDQNLIIIDDAPIYNPSHLLGFYSLIIPDFTKEVTVYKSDVPASMGDRLASIVSIRTQDGNLKKAELNGAFNPLINRLSASLPLFRERSAIFASVRRSNFGWIYQNAPGTPDIRFWDFHLKWNFRINENNRVFFTTIQSGDVMASGGSAVNGIRWGNSASTFRWNHIFNPRLFSNTTIYTGNYAYNLVNNTNYWKSELGTISLKTDFTHYAHPDFTARFGFELQGYYTNPGEISIDSTLGVFPNIGAEQSRKGVLYYQGAWDATSRLRLNLGLRWINWANIGPNTYFTFDEDYAVQDTVRASAGVYNNFNHLDPRVSLQYRLDSSSQVKFSMGVYHQYLQLVQNSVSPFTALEVWLPAGPNIRPQRATQWAIDYQKEFRKSGLVLNGSTYLKLARNQIDYEAHATTYLNPLLEAELRFGRSRAYGIEMMLKKETGRLTGWVQYSYARVFRQTQDLNGNQWYPAFQDRPHDFSFVVQYALTPRIEATAFWTSRSGSTFTSPVGFYTFQDQTIPLFGARNNDRLPAYHRLDLSLRFQLHRRANAIFKHHLVLSIYNALGHQNVYAVKFNKRYSPNFSPPVPTNTLSNELLSASQIDLIRFFPSLTYKFKI